MGDRADVVLKIAEMGARLEVVAATVRNYATVDYMDFTDAPTVEPCFVKEVFEYVVPAYLDVPGTCAKAANAKSSGMEPIYGVWAIHRTAAGWSWST